MAPRGYHVPTASALQMNLPVISMDPPPWAAACPCLTGQKAWCGAGHSVSKGMMVSLPGCPDSLQGSHTRWSQVWQNVRTWKVQGSVGTSILDKEKLKIKRSPYLIWIFKLMSVNVSFIFRRLCFKYSIINYPLAHGMKKYLIHALLYVTAGIIDKQNITITNKKPKRKDPKA